MTKIFRTQSEPTESTDRQASGTFFFFAHLALLIIVLVGFGPTFYLRPLGNAHPLPATLVLHGAVLTGWFALAVVQASLIRARQFKWHRRLGYITAGYAVLVLTMGVVADARMASAIRSSDDPELIVVWANAFSLVLYAGFVSLAVIYRTSAEAHRRLTLLASMTIVGPATARFTEWPIFPGGLDARPLYGIGGLLLLFGSLVVHDLVVRRRPHRASWIGALAMVLSLAMAAFLAISGTGFALLQMGPRM